MNIFWYILIGFLIVREIIIIIGLVTGKGFDADFVLATCLFPLIWVIVVPAHIVRLFKEEINPYILYIDSDTSYTISVSRYRKYYKKLKKELEREHKKKIGYLSRGFKMFEKGNQEYSNLLKEKTKRVKNYKHFKELYQIERILFE